MSAMIAGRWTVGAHGREIEPRFGELGKDSYMVISKLRLEGCQSSRKKLGECLSKAKCLWKIGDKKACLEH